MTLYERPFCLFYLPRRFVFALLSFSFQRLSRLYHDLYIPPNGTTLAAFCLYHDRNVRRLRTVFTA